MRATCPETRPWRADRADLPWQGEVELQHEVHLHWQGEAELEHEQQPTEAEHEMQRPCRPCLQQGAAGSGQPGQQAFLPSRTPRVCLGLHAKEP